MEFKVHLVPAKSKQFWQYLSKLAQYGAWWKDYIFKTLEYFSPPHLSKLVSFNEDDVLDDEIPRVFGVMPYMLELRLISGTDDEREPQGLHQEASDMLNRPKIHVIYSINREAFLQVHYCIGVQVQ